MIADSVDLVGYVIHGASIVLDQGDDRMLLGFDSIWTFELFIGLKGGSFPFQTDQQQANDTLRNGCVLRWAGRTRNQLRKSVKARSQKH